MTTERTLEGIRYTRRMAELDHWSTYGPQARNDVDWLLERIENQRPSNAVGYLRSQARFLADMTLQAEAQEFDDYLLKQMVTAARDLLVAIELFDTEKKQ